MNKIGILYGYWCTEWDVDYMPYLEKVKRLGFDTLEINTLRLTKMSDAEIEHFMGRAKELQIDVLGVIGVPARLDPAAPDATIRKSGIDYELNLIRTCAKAGIPCASGVLYSGWLSRLETHGATKAQCWKHSISSMKEISALAEDLGVQLNLEVVNRFENYLINTCDEVMSYIAEVGSPVLHAHLDTFHMNIEENSMSGAILAAGSRLGHFHVGENNRKPPGTGFLPWKEMVQALKQIDYQGQIVMEPFVLSGGTIGREISVYRELMPGADLDAEAVKSLQFLRSLL
jgi:D-psicose/D-tagatose/L-ribulose 3-epimerase